MKTFTTLLLAATVTSGSALAQTKTPARTAKPASTSAAPAARPAATKVTTTKPAAKPSTTTVSKPAPKPAPAVAPAPAPTPAAPAETQTTNQAADGELFRKGTTMVNFGVGAGLGYGYYGTLKSTPALSLSVEHGLREGIGPGTIGIGGLVGYKSYHYDYPSTNYKATWTNIIVAARGTYHYNLFEVPKLDTYAGLSLGVRIQKWSDSYYDEIPELRGYSSSSAYLTTGVFVGARYFFSNNIGAFTELGYDMNYLKLGLTAKF